MSLDTGPFRFETSYNISDVVQRESERSRIGPTADQLFVAFGVVGIACLFWRYTIALGAVTLALTTFAWALRERSQAMRKRFNELQTPPMTVHVVVTDTGYSISGDGFSAQTTSDHLVSGFERHGRLQLQAHQMPRVYLPVEQMHRAGVYERVQAIVEPRTASWKAAHSEALKVQP